MRSLAFAVLTAVLAGPAAANVITSHYSSFYVLGDSLSDDGNINGLVWRFTTGGSPYQGNWRDGGTFTNGDVWNEPLQKAFRKAGHDADNFAVGKARSSGGSWLIPDLGGQIEKLVDYTTRGERGSNPLVSIWIGANNVIDALTDGDDAVETAISAAKRVASGMRKLAKEAGVRDFVVFNLPNLGKTPQYRLFETDRRSQAIEAAKAYNKRLAKGIGSLESDGLNVIDVDVWTLLSDAVSRRVDYGFTSVKFPCVFPSESAADEYDQPRRCSSSKAEGRLFIDGLHVNALAHEIIGDFVESRIEADILARRMLAAASAESGAAEPVPTPLPPSAALLLGGAAGLFVASATRRRRRA